MRAEQRLRVLSDSRHSRRDSYYYERIICVLQQQRVSLPDSFTSFVDESVKCEPRQSRHNTLPQT